MRLIVAVAVAPVFIIVILLVGEVVAVGCLVAQGLPVIVITAAEGAAAVVIVVVTRLACRRDIALLAIAVQASRCIGASEDSALRVHEAMCVGPICLALARRAERVLAEALLQRNALILLEQQFLNQGPALIVDAEAAVHMAAAHVEDALLPLRAGEVDDLAPV